MANVNFIVLVINNVVHTVVIACLAANISPLLTTNGLKGTVMSVAVGAAFLVMGIIGAVLNSSIMSRWKKYKLNLSVCLAGTAASYFFSFLAFRLKAKVLCVVFPGLLGFFEIPMRAQDVAFICEVAYPVSEPVIVGTTTVVYCVVSLAAVSPRFSSIVYRLSERHCS